MFQTKIDAVHGAVVALANMLEFSTNFTYGLLVYLFFGALAVSIHVIASVGNMENLYHKEYLNFFKERGTYRTCLIVFCFSIFGLFAVLVSLRRTPVKIKKWKFVQLIPLLNSPEERDSYGLPIIR